MKGAREPRSGMRAAVVRSSGRDRSARWLLALEERWSALLERHTVWLCLFLVLATGALLPRGTFFRPRVEAGTIASRDYVASRDLLVPDPEITDSRRARARAEVLPVFDLDDGLATERDRQMAEAFAVGRAWLADPETAAEEPSTDVEAPGGGEAESERPGTLVDALRRRTGLRITPEAASVLEAEAFGAGLEEELRALLQETLGRGVVADKVGLLENRARGITLRRLGSGEETVELDLYDVLAYPEEVEEEVRRELRGVGLSRSRDREALAELILDNLTPNLLPNRSETLMRQESAAEATSTVYTQIRKGQMIVRKGDEVSGAEAQVISTMSGRQRLAGQLLPPLGTILLLSLASLVLWIGLAGEATAGKSRSRLFSEVLIVLGVALLASRFGIFLATASSGAFNTPPFNSADSYLYGLPLAALALVAQLLHGRSVALLLAVIYSILVGLLVGVGGDGLSATIYTAAGSLAAIHAVDPSQFKQRSVMMRAGLRIAGVNAIVILTLDTIGGQPLDGLGRIGFDLLCGAAGGVLCAAVASFAIPVAESVLSITTDIKLVELANTNLPLLRRLALEAPGTFQHSLMVANLAKAGCEEIGADSVLAYTGALYHDIGKTFRPEYFIENQRTGHNPHDSLSPSMSTLILVSHIKDGVELARRHGLPRPLVDSIEQHHGTRKITFFYNRALEQTADPASVREEKYRYPGPRPQDKVQGVLMIADGVEAASRTLVDPNPARIRSLIDRIVGDCLADGQLDATDLTLSDIRRVSDAFLRLLCNLYHRRVDYPGFDFNRDPEESGGAVSAAEVASK